jgi:putative hemolysin
MRYLFGCVSLETVDPAVGWALYDNFRENGKVSDFVFASPVDGFKLERPAMDDDMGGRKLMRFIPPLFKGYLRLGANICGEPALDREFGTIDYFILLDTHLLPKRYQRHFKEKEDAGQ